MATLKEAIAQNVAEQKEYARSARIKDNKKRLDKFDQRLERWGVVERPKVLGAMDDYALHVSVGDIDFLLADSIPSLRGECPKCGEVCPSERVYQPHDIAEQQESFKPHYRHRQECPGRKDPKDQPFEERFLAALEEIAYQLNNR